ncbi:ENTH-domain-containing protein [Rhizodiscina lignyota]|uniref:ENTH-domain-containing protein n=1 Tax=Rhizodiscina lignyota TaxID=1504668 RepID=A0A9P4MFN1_9PEZI|nr:ENTH-domain-containing protein [Rhizodiscina lignyota]
MSKVVRSVKNVTKGYTSAQVKVRNATSNDPWGPVGSDMAEIAQMTFQDTTTFYEIMDMLDKRLNDKGKNWRHVLKSLKVLDYCLHEGSELVVTWARKNIYIIKTLREFQYIDEDGRDVGQNVRVSAKELTALISDEERLRAERQDRRSWKSRVTGIEEFGPGQQGPIGGIEGGRGRSNTNRDRRRPNAGTEEDDLEYRLAIEASKNEAEEQARRRARDAPPENDDDLAKAIKLSKEEEELRRRQLEDSNAQSLFDDTPAQASQPTGFNQGYQQQGAVDWFGNLLDQQQPQAQPQQTGFAGVPGQQTGYQNGFGYGTYQQQPQQPQQTGYDAFQQLQQPQQQFVQPQQTAFNVNNPYGQQLNGYGAQQQPQQVQQQESGPQAGSHNPWATGLQQDAVKPQPTGSNNPFASSFNRPQSAQTHRPPTLATLSEQRVTNTFSSPSAGSLFTSPQPQQQAQPFQPQQTAKPQDPHRARLDALLSSGEGQDTFGNVGDLRIPAQHTAPGTFVNSAGAGLNRVTANATGTNPFLNSQFTGMPQTNRIAPAQTGPAAGFGAGGFGGGAQFAQTGFGGSPNPFGAQQPRQQQGGGSLIDL